MTKDDLFKLWGKILNGDKDAKKEMCELYLKEYPDRADYIEETKGNYSKSYLHTMYIHLRIKGK